MRRNENKILVILSIGTIISFFFIIRECSYTLVWNTAVMRWLFISQSNERLISNIAYSYVAAYIFYIMQVYIPKILNKRNVCGILAPKMEEFIFKISELAFVMEQICYRHDGGILVKQTCFPLYYKITVDNVCNVKKVGGLNTLMEMQRRIEESYALLLDRFVIYNLDVSILELWEKIPLKYYREIIWITKHTEDNRVPIIIKGIKEGDGEIINHIKPIFGIKTEIRFEKTEKQEVKDKYEKLAMQSSLREPDLVLQLEGNIRASRR